MNGSGAGGTPLGRERPAPANGAGKMPSRQRAGRPRYADGFLAHQAKSISIFVTDADLKVQAKRAPETLAGWVLGTTASGWSKSLCA